jgi:hypothetical protein
MRTFEVTDHGHRFELSMSLWTGKERIVCDGRVVSEKRSFQQLTPHIFTIREGSADVVYEINLIGGGIHHGYIVRRNGIAVACKP